MAIAPGEVYLRSRLPLVTEEDQETAHLRRGQGGGGGRRRQAGRRKEGEDGAQCLVLARNCLVSYTSSVTAD